MRNFKLILFIAFITISPACIAQTYGELPTISAPSVNERFTVTGNNDIDLYKGRNEVTIPIYSLDFAGTKLPLALTYVSGNGLKVKDLSGYYGLGWELTGGGVISRNVMGIPDEEPKGYCGTERFGVEINGYNENTLTTSVLDKIGKDGYDGEPDLFVANTPYFSFQFVLDQNGNVKFPNPNGFKVIHNLNNNTNYTNTNFEVIDNFGNRFLFGSSAASKETVTTKLGTTDKTFISSWFLDQIIWFNDKARVNFSYSSSSNYTITNSIYSKTTFVSSPTCSISDMPETKVDHTLTVNSPKYLTKIETANAKVDIAYEFNREDISALPKLATINVSSLAYDGTSSLLQSFALKYSYAGNVASNNRRLFLASIEKAKSDGNLQLAILDYYNDNPLPSVSSKEFDYWGYYNTNTTGSATHPAANKQPDISRTVSGLLKSVKYLTGGKTTFIYEPNVYYNTATASNVTGGGVRLSKISIADENAQEINFTELIYQETNGNSTGQIQSENYKQFSKQINLLIVGSSGYCGIVGTNTSSNSAFCNEEVNDGKVGYSKVIKKAKDNSKEEYIFSNYSEFPDVFVNRISNNSAYSFAQSRQLNVATSFGYKRGKLKHRIIYNDNNQIVSEDVYEYSGLGSATNSNLSIKLAPQTFVLGSNVTVWLYGVAYTLNDNYRIIRQKSIVHSQTNLNEIIESIIEYTYTGNNRQVRKITQKTSKGETIENINYYSNEGPSIAGNPMFSVNDVTILNELAARNVLDHSVYTKVVRNSNISETCLYFEKNTVETIDKYFLKLVRSNLNGQIVKEKYSFFDKNTANYISGYEKDHSAISYQWGYRNSYQIAEVVNAKSNEIMFNSFEEGGWDGSLTAYDKNFKRSGVGSGRIDKPTTGEQVSMSTSWLNVTLSAPTKFKYSGWVYSTGPSAEIFLFMKKADETAYFTYVDSRQTTQTNKWVYIEGEYTVPVNITQLNIRVDNNGGGTVWFDDIRLHPSAARMTTYTYAPLIGMTSQTDVNNRTTYYEYDGLGRLALVRDHDKNILKKICYNYAGQPENCAADATPLWQPTGIIRCRPCPANSTYITNVQEHEEKDNNLNSPTYNTYRWVSDGVNSNCVIVADWQNTAAAIRCKTVGGVNTGEQEQEQRDMNPCSPTANQTRWVVVDQNCSVCPKPANWQITGNYLCVSSGGANTGYQEREEKDMESCSPTYNQTRWVNIGINCATCPKPASWQNTGNYRCVTSGGINTGYQEREEKDMESCSPTYNQTRWVNIGINCATCPKPANWQNTGNYRCVTSGGANTGYQEREQRDMESCSPTYNQTRWVDNGQNVTACPVTIYAKIFVTDVYNDITRTTATILIRFFSNPACTIPISVNNLSVNYKKVRTNCGGGSPLTYNYSVNCSGTQTSLGTETIVWDDGMHCWEYTFSVTAGSGYQLENYYYYD